MCEIKIPVCTLHTRPQEINFQNRRELQFIHYERHKNQSCILLVQLLSKYASSLNGQRKLYLTQNQKENNNNKSFNNKYTNI